MIHPVEDSLIYEKAIKDYQQLYTWRSSISEGMTSIEKVFFQSKIDGVLQGFSSDELNGITIDQYRKDLIPSSVKGFQFLLAGEKQYCLLIPIQIADRPDSLATQFS